MHWRGWLISAIAIAGAVHVTASLAQPHIGSAASARNLVEGIIGSETQPIVAGTTLFLNERVRTGDESQAQLVFLDETNLAVGPKSEVTLNRFVYNPDRGTGRIAIEASRGVFRFVTGSPGKKNYEVSTPVATIEVKGTEFHLLVEQEYIVIALVHGTVRIVTVRGRVLWQDQPGTTVTIYANGRVDGPMPWTGPVTRYASDVPFPYFANQPAQASLTLRPAGSVSRPMRRLSVWSWTGFYVGADIGSGRMQNADNTFADVNDVAFNNCDECTGAFGSQNVSMTGSGFLRGLHAGYNLQIAPTWLVGVEGDFIWSGIKTSSNSVLTSPNFPITGSNLTFQTDMDWMASLRARAGFIQDNWLFYATGGVAWADLDFSAGAVCPLDPAGNFCFSTIQASSAISSVRAGYVVGGGIEWQAPTIPLRARAEYLYYAFNGTDAASPSWTASFLGPCLVAGPCVANFSSGNVTVQTFRVGLSYRLN
ncbi:MAG: FecR domain-containing protein [Xanthobacteraceae bacterium]